MVLNNVKKIIISQLTIFKHILAINPLLTGFKQLPSFYIIFLEEPRFEFKKYHQIALVKT